MTPQQLTPHDQPYLIQSRAIYPCPHCGNPLKSVFRPPSNSSNWLMLMIGLLLAPFLIGIIILISYNHRQRQEARTTWWHCESCGWHAAARRLEPTPAERRRQRRLLAVAGIGVLVIISIICLAKWTEWVDRQVNTTPVKAQSFDKEKRDGKQSKPRRSKVDSRAGNVEGGEDK